MKYKIKRFALILMGLTMLICLSGCTKTVSIDENTQEEIIMIAEKTVSDIVGFDDLSLQSAVVNSNSMGKTIITQGLESWINNKDLIGKILSIGNTKVEEVDGGYLASVMLSGERRNAIFNIGFDKNLSFITQLSVNPVYSLGEKMQKAGLNTIMGMGTVFVVLIFISIIISLFKYIHMYENRLKDKKNDKIIVEEIFKEDIAPIDDTSDLVDDLELVAVITAAIKASENISTDNLVVRSIKRVNKNRR